MMKPRDPAGREHGQVPGRVAAAGVAKASGMVCARVRHPSRPGKRRTRVWEAGATAGAVLELAEQLAGEGIGKITLEAASDCWRIWFYLLEAAGLSVQLVGARDVKNALAARRRASLTASGWRS